MHLLDARCETLLLSHHCFDVNRRMLIRRRTLHRARAEALAERTRERVNLWWLVKLCSATRGLGDAHEHQTYALPGSDPDRIKTYPVEMLN
jgi:hypothetical protein